MNYWWVNHKQTFAHENKGGYIWSPKLKSNGAFSQSYHNLTLCRPSDLIFSYASGKIQAVGVVSEEHKESERPSDFGELGEQWDRDGWLVKVTWTDLPLPIVPKNYLTLITPLLPELHSPIQKNGNGNQGVYLASIDEILASALIEVIGDQDSAALAQLQEITNSVLEEQEAQNILNSSTLPLTEKPQLIKARVGQGLYRIRVQKIEKACRLTGVSDERFLIASHIKPWRYSTNEEKLDGNNGLLLSPHVDKLFDKGWISFSDEGDLLIADKSFKPILVAWDLVDKASVGSFTAKQKAYLAFHREHVYQQKLVPSKPQYV